MWLCVANNVKRHGCRRWYRRSIHSRSVPLNDRAKTYLNAYLSERALAGLLNPAAPLFPSRKHGLALTRWQANRIVHAETAPKLRVA